MSLFLHLRDRVVRVKDTGIPVPLDPDLLFLAENAKNQSVIQDIYRQQMERNRYRPQYGDHAGHAKEGGESGKNGEFYKGGQFLPSSKHTEKGKYRTGGPSLKYVKKDEVTTEPGKREKPPSPLHRSIYEVISPWLHEAKEGREYLDVPYAKREEAKAKGAKFDWDRKKWYMEQKGQGHKLELRPEVYFNNGEKVTREVDMPIGAAGHRSTQKYTMGDLIDRYNRGERWVKVKLPPGVDPPEFRDADPDWEEHLHPRDPDGKFTSGGGATSPTGKTAKASWQEKPKEETPEESAPTVYNSDFAKWGFEYQRDDHDGKRAVRIWKNDKTGTILSAEISPQSENIGDWKLIDGDEVLRGFGKRDLTSQLDQRHERNIAGPKPPDKLKTMVMQTNGMKYDSYNENSKRWMFKNDWREETLEISSESLRGMGVGGRFWEHIKPGVRYNGYGEGNLRRHLERSEKGEIYEGKFSRHWGETLKPHGFEMTVETDTAAVYKNRDGDAIFIFKDTDKPESAKWRVVLFDEDAEIGQRTADFNEGKGWDELHETLGMLKDEHEARRETEKKHRAFITEQYTTVAADMMKSLGYPPAKLTISFEPYKFTLNGRQCQAAGLARFATGEVVLYPRNLSEAGIRGVTAHEVMHQKFQAALNEYNVEANDIGQDRRRDVGGEQRMLTTNTGEVPEEYKGDYPVYELMHPYLSVNHKFNELKEKDGVTGYSREWWEAFNKDEATKEQAMHETLAEMAYLEVTNPPELKKVAKPWRDLYQNVTALYKDQERRKWHKAERRQQRQAATPAPKEPEHPATILAHALTQVLEKLSDRAPFKESEHPRGQPGNAGQFVSEGEGSTSTQSHVKEPETPAPKQSKGLPGSKGHPALISTRHPSHVKAVEGDEYRRADLAAMKEHEKNFDHDTALFNNPEQYPNFRPGELDCAPAKGDSAVSDCADKRAAAIINHMKKNLRFLYDNAPKLVREQGHLWYEGAHRLAAEDAKKYGVPLQSTVGVYAALSPQKLWDMNVYLAKQVLEIYHTKQDHSWDSDMDRRAKEIWKPKDAALLSGIKGKKLSELSDPILKAMWIRTYDEAHHDRHFDALSPDGRVVGTYKTNAGNPAIAAWNTTKSVANAVTALESGGDRDKISPAMGDKHKVRSFYNNILDPDSENGDVTMDTHAVGAALLSPMGGSHTAVMHSLGLTPNTKEESAKLHYQKPSTNNRTGLDGTYPLYAEAYRELAKDLGIQPRVLQSITWEAKRRLFDEHMTNKAKGEVYAAWREYHDGKASLEDVQKRIVKIAGGFAKGQGEDDDTGGRSPGKDHAVSRRTGDARELRRHELGRGDTRTVDTGGRGRDTRRIAARARRIWQDARRAVFLHEV